MKSFIPSIIKLIKPNKVTLLGDVRCCVAASNKRSTTEHNPPEINKSKIFPFYSQLLICLLLIISGIGYGLVLLLNSVLFIIMLQQSTTISI